MNKNLIIAFLVGVIITLVAVNYLPKFDIKIEMAEKSEPVKIDETQKDDSFLTETTEIVNNTISKNKKIEEKPSKPANELSAKEEKTNPLDKYLPNKDKYKDLENNQYSYSEPVELEERTDPFDIPDRPEPIKEPDIPLINIPQPKRPEMRSESVSTPDFTLKELRSPKVNVSRDPKMKPIVKVPPQYPRRAMERCLEGWGLVEFTVTETGAVVNPRIIDADPPGIFNRSILRTIVKWKYKPTISKGKAVPVTGIQHLLNYELDDNYQIKCMKKNHKSLDNIDVYPIKRVQAKYPKKEQELGIEGSVIVEFDVLASGKVNNPIITSSKPTGVFNKSSLEAARKWKYLPAKINGKPINRKRVRLMITYRNGLTSALPIGYGKYD